MGTHDCTTTTSAKHRVNLLAPSTEADIHAAMPYRARPHEAVIHR
jgi:hypothetical protein